MDKKNKIKLVFLLSLLLIIVVIYANIIHMLVSRKRFAKNNIEVYQKNEEKVFKIEKVLLCNSANAIDKSEEKNLQDLSIYQYSDIAIYIDNGGELTNKNTVNELYIDNICLEGEKDVGLKTLDYKNILNFGLKEDIDSQKEQKANIKFNIIYTNEQNDEADYNEPTFYTDCSNPITLEYLNYNILTGYKMEENNSVSFNGNILEKAGIEPSDINVKVKFRINIINNKNEKYSCWLNIKIPLEDIYKGTTMKSKEIKNERYIFFRE